MNYKQVPLCEEFLQPLLPGAIEDQLYARGFRQLAGVDEVGRGPLAGPVVAAAVIFPHGFSHPEIKDSKLLTAARRQKLVTVIERAALSWGIGIVEVEEIDRDNILNASLRAMVKALASLQAPPDCVLVDGDQVIPGEFFNAGAALAKLLPGQRTVVRGDQLCCSIAAASILAKVERDGIMAKLDEGYPEYGFADHKGYGSAAHLEALRRYGPCPVHRRSFKPVRELCHDDTAADLPLFSAGQRDD
jgi:ribonuclease HII